jgi:hypothetical protein
LNGGEYVRRTKEIALALRARWLRLALTVRNRLTRESAVGSEPVVVSMTSFGRRLDDAWLALESIASGRVRPARLVLWLTYDDYDKSLSPALERLKLRGLEVVACADYGPHKKYYPYVATTHVHEKPLVTADDDVFYPRYWLRGLLESYVAQPGSVYGWRGREIVMEGSALAPYATWPTATERGPSSTRFLTGVGGVLYPPEALRALKTAGEGFLECCPRADDIWLFRTALRAGLVPSQIRARARHFPTIPGSQGEALLTQNQHRNGNDTQLKATLSRSDLLLIQRHRDEVDDR